jgi:signal transduction histidine kinase
MLGYSIGAMLLIFALFTRDGSIWLIGVLLGVMAIWVVSQVGSSWWLERSFITLSLPLALAVASIAARGNWVQVMAGGALLALLVLPNVVAVNMQREEGRSEAEAAIALAAFGDLGDVVVVGNWPSLRYALLRYAKDLSLDIRETPDGETGAFYSVDELTGHRCEKLNNAEIPVNWWRCELES